MRCSNRIEKVVNYFFRIFSWSVRLYLDLWC